MPKVRVLHFSDLHIGVENYGRPDPETGLSTRLGDFLDALDEVARVSGEAPEAGSSARAMLQQTFIRGACMILCMWCCVL